MYISNNTSTWWICILRMNGVSDHHLSLLFWNHLGTTSDGPPLFSLYNSGLAILQHANN
jgi:hypothetical protein